MNGGTLPDSVAPQDAILVAFRRRLPLYHDGLVGPAAGDDVLRRSTRRLLWERDPDRHKHKDVKRKGRKTITNTEAKKHFFHLLTGKTSPHLSKSKDVRAIQPPKRYISNKNATSTCGDDAA